MTRCNISRDSLEDNLEGQPTPVRKLIVPDQGVTTELLPRLSGNIGNGVTAAIREPPFASLSVAPFLTVCWREGPELFWIAGYSHVRLVVKSWVVHSRPEIL